MARFLRFREFTIDIGRAALRLDGSEHFPRRKVFDLLCCLAENAGQLVEKQALFARIWPDAAVTDDALVQCVRELRALFGDGRRHLVRTITGRGYLLDAAPLPPAEGRGEDHPVPTGVAPPRTRSRWFTEADAQLVARIAREKALPIPPIEIDAPDDDVPEAIRRFVGVWVSGKGFVNSNRQFMLIVSHVEREGLVGGHTVRGPPAPNSYIKNPAEAVSFTALIADGVMTYANPRGSYRIWFVDEAALIFQQTYTTGYTTMVALRPIWTLSAAEEAGGRAGAPTDGRTRH